LESVLDFHYKNLTPKKQEQLDQNIQRQHALLQECDLRMDYIPHFQTNIAAFSDGSEDRRQELLKYREFLGQLEEYREEVVVLIRRLLAEAIDPFEEMKNLVLMREHEANEKL
jgi:hypothetical protein